MKKPFIGLLCVFLLTCPAAALAGERDVSSESGSEMTGYPPEQQNAWVEEKAEHLAQVELTHGDSEPSVDFPAFAKAPLDPPGPVPWNPALDFARSTASMRHDWKGHTHTEVLYYDDKGRKIAGQDVEIDKNGFVRNKHSYEFETVPGKRPGKTFTQDATYIWKDAWLDHIFFVSCQKDACDAWLDDYDQGIFVARISLWTS